MKAFAVISLMVLFTLAASAQDRQGIRLSNYTPTQGIFLNPSFSAQSNTYLQINIFGAGVFAMTNLGYIPGFQYWSAISTGETAQAKISTLRFKKWFYGNASIEGPGFSLCKDKFGVGVFTRARSAVNVRRLPHQLTSLLIGQEPVGPDVMDIELHNAGFSNFSWVELGLNGAYVLKEERRDVFILGGNIRRIWGYNILHTNVKDLQAKWVDTVITVQAVDARFVSNTPAFGGGKGFALDIGVTYKRMLDNADGFRSHSLRSQCRLPEYKLKLGLSLRDLGYARFKNDPLTRNISGDGLLSVIQHKGQLTRINVDQVTTSEKVGPVTAWLPLAISAQADFNFENGIYLGAVLVKNLLPPGVVGVQAHDMISIVPRFETQNIEVAFPVTLQKYFYPQLGFALRVRTFVFGLDNLLPAVMHWDTYGAGAYVSLGISIFKPKPCQIKTRRVDDCMPGKRSRSKKGPGLLKRILNRNKTYSK